MRSTHLIFYFYLLVTLIWPSVICETDKLIAYFLTKGNIQRFHTPIITKEHNVVLYMSSEGFFEKLQYNPLEDSFELAFSLRPCKVPNRDNRIVFEDAHADYSSTCRQVNFGPLTQGFTTGKIVYLFSGTVYAFEYTERVGLKVAFKVNPFESEYIKDSAETTTKPFELQSWCLDQNFLAIVVGSMLAIISVFVRLW